MAHVETAEAQTAQRRYVRAAMRQAMLDRGRELDLARRWRESGDQAALHELTSAYLRLVIAAATRYRHYGLPVSDLIQEGNIGLMQAAARFEPERDVRFSTYAAWWIRSAIQDYILRNWSIVRTGTTAAQKSLFFNLRRLKARLDDGAGGYLTLKGLDSVAATLKVERHEVAAMDGRLAGGDRSLNAPVGEDGEGDWQGLLADERPLPDEMVMERHDGDVRRRHVREAMAKLSSREAAIVQARLLDDEAETLESLGRRLGVSKERVRQLEHAALKKLKASLLTAIGDPITSGMI